MYLDERSENMDNMTLKPISMVYDEFVKSITDLINNSMLPPFVIKMILKDFYNSVVVLSNQQLEQDKISYEEELAKSNNS